MFLLPFTKTVVVPSPDIYSQPPGTFGVIMSKMHPKTCRMQWEVEWMSCRDSFHNAYIRSLWFGVHLSADSFLSPISFFFVGDPERTAKFVHEIERHLCLSLRSKFLNTDHKNIVCLVPNLFWRSCPMRMSFFTIILKASLIYKDGWEDCLFQFPYVKDTQIATNYFLSGHTVYCGYSNTFLNGWRSCFRFCQSPPEELRRPRLLSRLFSSGLLFVKKIFSSKFS